MNESMNAVSGITLNVYFKQSKTQMLKLKTKTCINSIPFNIINVNEQVHITINIKISTSYHITKSMFGGFVLLCYLF